MRYLSEITGEIYNTEAEAQSAEAIFTAAKSKPNLSDRKQPEKSLEEQRKEINAELLNLEEGRKVLLTEKQSILDEYTRSRRKALAIRDEKLKVVLNKLAMSSKKRSLLRELDNELLIKTLESALPENDPLLQIFHVVFTE